MKPGCRVFGWRGALAGATALVAALTGGPSRAAVVAWDNFESYSNGETLNGKNGGSGWTSSWSGDATLVTAQANVIQLGGRSLQITRPDAGSNDNVLERPFTSQSGTFYVGFVLRTTGGFESTDYLQVFINDTAGGGTDSVRNGLSGGSPLQTDSPFFARASTSSGNETTAFSSTAYHTQNTTQQVVIKVSKDGSSN